MHKAIVCFILLVHTIAAQSPLKQELSFQGHLRHYLYVASLNDKPKPILFVLHGGGGTAERSARLKSGFLSLVSSHNFLVVYPQGLDKQWRDGRDLVKAKKFKKITKDVDDLAFLKKIARDLSKSNGAGLSNVFITGMSNGAMMSYRVACEGDGFIRAFAPVTGVITDNIYDKCKFSKETSALIINGTKDSLVPYEGGQVRFFFKKLGKIRSVDESFAKVSQLNHCKSQSNQVLKNTKKVMISRSFDCSKNSEVLLYKVIDGGHTWPGSKQHISRWLVGDTNQEFSATEAIKKFFIKHLK
ncbi:MAG: hypothetical protein KC646_08405 [Candidatus Cloacimonetes bacterium]|nr:hypothetical protein [Candidatus Cloacimonadota bacterium]